MTEISDLFFDGNLNADKYFTVLQEEISPFLLYEDGNFPIYFQQDGAPSHLGIHVRLWLDQLFAGAWPPRSLDLSPLDFYPWGG